ncbi:MAG: ABC transporter substrate-binding protein [Pseudorhodoplanes sp.]
MKPDTRKSRGTVQRRSFLKLTAGAALSTPTLLLAGKVNAAPTKLIITDVGGPYTKAFQEVFYKPFMEKMKGEVEIVQLTVGSLPTAETEQMVKTKNYIWDLVDINSFGSMTLAEKGLVEEVQLDNDPDVQQLPKAFRTPYTTGLDTYASVFAYSTEAFPSGKEPTSWKDVWDVKSFPGRRCLRKWPFDTVEQALLADGVDVKKLYPCDFDRAYKSLDKIKPHVATWWTTGAQTSQVMSNREVDITACWNTRAQPIIDGGGKVKICWNGGLLNWHGWVIPKGNPKVELCRKFLAFSANAKQQALLPNYTASGPCNPEAYKYMASNVKADTLPTYPKHMEQMTVVDDKFWAPLKESELVRFNNWLLT